MAIETWKMTARFIYFSRLNIPCKTFPSFCNKRRPLINASFSRPHLTFSKIPRESWQKVDLIMWLPIQHWIKIKASSLNFVYCRQPHWQWLAGRKVFAKAEGKRTQRSESVWSPCHVRWLIVAFCSPRYGGDEPSSGPVPRFPPVRRRCSALRDSDYN